MTSTTYLTASLVIYNNDFVFLRKTIKSFLAINCNKKLFLIDNSKSAKLKGEFDHPEIEYIFSGKNLGFGRGHNSIINRIPKKSSHHLILNPDVWFESSIIKKLIAIIDGDPNIAVIAPKILYANGDHQYSCRRYPTLFELFIRRFHLLKKMFKRTYERGIYADLDIKKSFNPDCLHGCFLLFKTKDFIRIKGFDERYFLYMEDIDICKKIDTIGKKKLYYPNEQIFHALNQESRRNLKAFIYHIKSIFQYFYKWKFAK